ncbi:MAG TPA: hypothetical protein VJA21_02230 [Verrucomicrobiae bacterium]
MSGTPDFQLRQPKRESRDSLRRPQPWARGPEACRWRLAGLFRALAWSSWVAVLTVAAALPLSAATAQPPPARVPLSPALRTNLPATRLTATNALARPRPGVTNAAASKAPGTNTVASLSKSLKERFDRVQSHQAFYPALIGVGVCVVALIVLRGILSRKKARAVPASAITKATAKAYRSPRAVSVHACNVLEVGPGARQVWQFEPRGGNYVLNREHTAADGVSLPSRLVGKDWRSLFYRKLNIAWLPPEHVFLRAAQFPRSDFNETLSMVELQLEKLSPIPVAQIAWSIHVLPHADGDMQTVIVMIASRSVVEEFLGKLEGQGFLADRLELPLLDQLQTTAITEDGAWIYPEAGDGKNTALVAWWYGGVLRNLDLVALPADRQPGSLKEQLTQMAWAGEMEGWLGSSPEWHLVADAVVAAVWEPALRQGLEQPVEVITPLATRDLAALTARRSAQADPRANLMPLEFAERYRQQFVDRLWMRGLLGLAGLYALGVAVYMVALGYVSYKTDAVETEMRQMATVYTNALQLKARFQVLQDRQDLKYAALDCWNTTARYLPESVNLDSLTFSQGKRLSLNGTAPADASTKLNDFEAAMRKHTINGQPLFDPARGETLTWRVSGSTATWTLGLELKRAEVQ